MSRGHPGWSIVDSSSRCRGGPDERETSAPQRRDREPVHRRLGLLRAGIRAGLLSAVGGVADGVTFFVGSIFFTSRLLPATPAGADPAMTGVDEARAGPPEPVRLVALAAARSELARRDHAVPGNAVLQREHPGRPGAQRLRGRAGPARVAAGPLRVDALPGGERFGILAVPAGSWSRPAAVVPWCIAWLNMIGSILFMASALASFVLPSSGDVINARVGRRHAARRAVLPARSRADVPGLAASAVRIRPSRRQPSANQSTPTRRRRPMTTDPSPTPTPRCSATASSPRRCRPGSSRTRA